MTQRTLCAADIKITDTAIVNALLAVQDSVMQTWIIDSGASFHCTPKECFLSFFVGNFGKVYLGNNHTCNIEGLGGCCLSGHGEWSRANTRPSLVCSRD